MFPKILSRLASPMDSEPHTKPAAPRRRAFSLLHPYDYHAPLLSRTHGHVPGIFAPRTPGNDNAPVNHGRKFSFAGMNLNLRKLSSSPVAVSCVLLILMRVFLFSSFRKSFAWISNYSPTLSSVFHLSNWVYPNYSLFCWNWNQLWITDLLNIFFSPPPRVFFLEPTHFESRSEVWLQVWYLRLILAVIVFNVPLLILTCILSNGLTDCIIYFN